MRKRTAFTLALLFYASILPWNGDAAYLNTNVGELVVKTGPWVDVRAHGAVSGAADSRAEIQAAVDSLTSGGVVFFPTGIWNVSSAIIVPSNIRFVGTIPAAYRGPCQIRITANNQSAFEIRSGVKGFAFENIEIASDDYDTDAITGRSGVKFNGNVASGTVDRGKFTNMTFRNLNRGVYIYDNVDFYGGAGGQGWSVDSINFDHTYFVENHTGVEIDSANATGISFTNGTYFGQWDGASRGIYAKYGGYISIRDTTFGCASGCVGGWALEAVSLTKLSATQMFTEGPGAIWFNVGGGAIELHNFVWTVSDSLLGAVQIDGSPTYTSKGNWYNDNVTFGNNAAYVSAYSYGDRFSSGNDFRWDNTSVSAAYVKVYNEKQYLNPDGDSSPKWNTGQVLTTSYDNIVTYSTRPSGMYQVSIHHKSSGSTNVYCQVIYPDSGGNTITKNIQDNVAITTGTQSVAPTTVWSARYAGTVPLQAQCKADNNSMVTTTGVVTLLTPRYAQ